MHSRHVSSQRILIGVIGALFVAGITPALASMPNAQAVEQARQASQNLLSRLQGTLKQALQSGGPVAGIQVCSQVGQSLTQQVGQEHHVEIRRVSLKTRNPLNQPDAFEKKVLNNWLTIAPGAQTEHIVRVVENGQPVLRYMKPIRMQTACLQCHGPTEQITPEVKALIDQVYPGDRATGYQEGSLRGAISVKIPL